MLIDLFTFTPWRIELEKELAIGSQFLDVAIIALDEDHFRRSGVELDLPDGLDNLRPHNLLTFKSHHEALSAWAAAELLGHYVSYRKSVRHGDRLIPEAKIGLYAVTVRFPRELARQVELRPTRWHGIFDTIYGAHHIRTVVLRDIERHPRNAFWELFTLDPDRLRHGRTHYRFRRPETKTLVANLYWDYRLEGIDMPYTYEDVIGEARQEFLQHLTPEQRRALLDEFSTEERLRGLGPEERLRGLGPEERLRGLSPDQLRKLKEQLDRLN